MTSFVAAGLRPLHSRVCLIIAAVTLAVAGLASVLVSSLTVLSASVGSTRGASLGASLPESPASGVSVGPGALSPQLARLADAYPRRRVEVIIQLARGVNASQGRALVRSSGGQPGLDLHIINGLSARLTASAARRLAASRLVHAVSLNAAIKESTLVNFNPRQMATVFDQSVGATRLWNFSTGKSVGVAVIDTGITGDSADFRTSQTNLASRVTASAVVDPNAATAADRYGHGTDVAGLIAGNGGYLDSADPLRGQYAGSAPDANLISIKISDDDAQATTLDAIYGLQFAVDHKSDYNIRVVNMSFRSTSAESYQTDPLDAAAEQAWFDGIVVVAAAGNLGTAPGAVSYPPGNDPYVLTVGAVDDQGTSSTRDDVETDWSSRGVTQDGLTKPDVLAPGAHIVSTLAPGSAFATLCPTCIIGGHYFQASGTSMAAPIVAGVAADLIAAHSHWTPDMVKGAIVNTADSLSGGGREVNAIDAYRARGRRLVSNQDFTPNSLIDPRTGTIDYSKAGWTAGSWSVAADPLAASWSAASWSCSDCSSGSSGTVSTTANSWSSLGWATTWN
jgi:serine protease AprX